MFGIFQRWRHWVFKMLQTDSISWHPQIPNIDVYESMSLSLSVFSLTNDCNLLKSDHLNRSCHSVQRQPWSSAGKATQNSTLTNRCAHPSGVLCGLSSPFQGLSGAAMHSFRIATPIIFSPTTKNVAKQRNLETSRKGDCCGTSSCVST